MIQLLTESSPALHIFSDSMITCFSEPSSQPPRLLYTRSGVRTLDMTRFDSIPIDLWTLETFPTDEPEYNNDAYKSDCDNACVVHIAHSDW